MGLLKNIVSNAVSDGIRKGIGNAVGKAVEKAVTPAAERFANKQAEAIDSVTAEVGKGIAQTNAAINDASASMAQAGAKMSEAGAAASEAKASLGGFAGLESALSGLASKAESFATQMSASMKVCPSCGQPSPADKSFCPNCGAKLPETTLGQDYTCSKCGAANTPGTKYCSKCGALLPGAEAEIKAQQAKDAQVMEQFASVLPQFPKWTGGHDYCLEQNGEERGYPVYTLNMAGNQKDLNDYIALLLQAGFKQYGDSYWKTVDGVCRTFNCTDAVTDNTIYVGYHVTDYDKQSAPKPAATEDPLADLKGAAKGLFKKFF